MTTRTWNDAPAILTRDSWGYVLTLPEGHDALGYAPGSQWYPSESELLDLEPRIDPVPAATEAIRGMLR